MNANTCRQLLSSQPVARLGTIGPSGPHLVPIVFAVHGDTIVTAVDHKPKRTAQLQRLANIAANPSVTVLGDNYDEDWEQLWWVRADGEASVIERGPETAAAVDSLVDKYHQYRTRRPPGPVVSISVKRWTGWRATPR